MALGGGGCTVAIREGGLHSGTRGACTVALGGGGGGCTVAIREGGLHSGTRGGPAQWQ